MNFVVRFYNAWDFEHRKLPWLNGLMYIIDAWMIYDIKYLVQLTFYHYKLISRVRNNVWLIRQPPRLTRTFYDDCPL